MGSGLAPIFGDFSQSEKVSEIKPPLTGQRTFLVWISRLILELSKLCLVLLPNNG